MKKVGIFGQSYKKIDRPYFETLIQKLNAYNIEIVIDFDFLQILTNLGVEKLKYATFSGHQDLDSSRSRWLSH